MIIHQIIIKVVVEIQKMLSEYVFRKSTVILKEVDTRHVKNLRKEL